MDMDINIRLLILECEEEALTIFRAVKQHFVMPSDIGCLHDFVYDARWAEYPMDCRSDPESSICPHLGYKLGQFLYPPALADLRAVVDGSNLSETGNIHTRLCLMYSNLSRDIVAATDGQNCLFAPRYFRICPPSDFGPYPPSLERARTVMARSILENLSLRSRAHNYSIYPLPLASGIQ